MKINGKHYRSIWEKPGNPEIVKIIDQRILPHRFEIVELKTAEDCARAIREMYVRGAPLIGTTAAYGIWLAANAAPKNSDFESFVNEKAAILRSSRPTAYNLFYALGRCLGAMENLPISEKADLALREARKIADEDINNCKKIGEYGLELIKNIAAKKNSLVNILTHCNAGWLATTDYGTATSPMYHAHEAGIDIHVWVDETRPRNQGAKLTAWELSSHGIKNTLIVDNAGGHLMQHGLVDICIVGSDRTSSGGDVANKIGTYLKALAAKDNSIPFYVALPSTTIDFGIKNGLKEIPIEKRDPDEILWLDGIDRKGEIRNILVPPKGTTAANYAFDVTPAAMVSGLITERGICKANYDSITAMFPDLIRRGAS